MIYKMTLNDSADEMTFDLLEVPIVDKDIEGAVDNVTLDGNQYTDYLWLKKQFVQKWSILCDDEYTRLRGFYTRQFENADVPSYRLYYGDDIIRNSTLSGQRIELSISGVADGTMSLTQMDGNIEQDGTPTPSAPVPVQTVTGRQTVTVAGKNLFNPTATPWGSKVAYNSSGTQVWWDGYYGIIEYQPVQPNTQYTFSNSAGKPILYGLVFYDANKTMLSTVPSATTTFTTPANCAYIRFAIQNDSAPTWTQLELGNQASAYEAYRAQDYEIDLLQNLSDPTQDTADHFIDSSGAEVSNTAWDISGYIPVVAGQTYSYEGITAAGNAPYSAFYNASKAYVSSFKQATGTNTITTPNGVSFVRFSIYHNEQYGDDDNLTFKFWDTPNQIELCKIGTYQDRIYKENGKWWLEKQTGKVVLNGSEDWHKSSNTQVDRYWYNIYSGDVVPSFHQIYSDKFFYQYNVPTVNAMWVDVYQTLERLFVNFASYGTTTVTNLKTWLASNPTTVYYILATPTTTEITNEALVEQLEALVDEAISVGLHNIYTDTPNALPTLTFDLTEYLSKSTTIIPETAVRLTLTDGGVINACGCRKDVQLTMRETIE